MNLKDFYTAINGDYDGVIGRMRSEALVKKFIFKFEEDPNFYELKEAFNQGNREDAFRAVHTIKGICQNLGFTTLLKSSSILTQYLRAVLNNESVLLMQQVEEDYKKIINAISELRNSESN